MARSSQQDTDTEAAPATALTPDDLHICCDPALLAFEDTSTLEPLPDLIGQERALGAIRLSASIGHADFNLFVLGPDGTGRHSAVQRLLAAEAAQRPTPQDWVYVNDFANPDRPKAIAMPPGTAPPLQKARQGLVDELANDIPARVESEQYQGRRGTIEQRLATRKQAGIEKLLEKTRDRNVTILSIPKLEKEHRSAVASLNAEMAEQAVDDALAPIDEAFGGIETVRTHLIALRADLIENAELFLREGNGRQEGPFPVAHAHVHDQPPFHRYGVNVLVSHDPATASGAPIVVEPLPSLSNLIGKVDHIS